MTIQEKIIKIKNKDYYIKLLFTLRNNGLYDIISDNDTNIDYSNLLFKLLEFLRINKKHIKSFQSKDFENILLLCVHEILTKKFNTEIDPEKLEIVLNLVKNSYLIKTMFIRIKDFTLKMYYKYRCNFCLSNNDIDIIEIEN
tara:strand:- start:31589 stop:32014 length:426 start_codon:yes stop_codon:yes gene_type:complete